MTSGVPRERNKKSTDMKVSPLMMLALAADAGEKKVKFAQRHAQLY